MNGQMKITLPPLIQMPCSSSIPMFSGNQQHMPRRHVFTSSILPPETPLVPLKPPLVVRTIFSTIPVQQSAYPFISEDQSFIQLTTTKHISESVPCFTLRAPLSERLFEDVCSDPACLISPRQFGFIPSSTWSSDSITFGTLVATFFRRRNSATSKFPYKLYNALRITEFIPDYFPHVGVKWVTDNIIWVNRESFARLLGVRTVEGGLFHQQGNFPSHGFEELSFEESERLAQQLGLGRIDLSVMRLIRHTTGLFKRDSKEADLERCKWKGG